jgi:hypothetical protein
MISRITTIDDSVVEAFKSLGPLAYKESGLLGIYTPEIMIRFWQKFFQMGIGGMWKYETHGHIVGLMGGVINMSMYDGKTSAEECFWFVHPKHRTIAGVRLFDAFKNWAKECKCDRIVMGSIHDHCGNIQKFLERNGFTQFQKQYMMEVQCLQ